MPVIERYPNYIGVDVTPLNALKISIKYTGGGEKKVLLTIGQLVSIGYTTNVNGVVGFETILGIVKEIGLDPIRREHTLMTNPPAVANPYWIKVDVSNTYASDIRHIYIRDIRDIAVGPMADGDLAKADFEGELLPDVNEANISLYIGKMFHLTKPQPLNPNDESGAMYPAGIYIRTSNDWVMFTIPEDIESSPLIGSSDIEENVGGVDNIRHYVRHDVVVESESLSTTTYDDITFIKLDTAVVDATQSKIRANRVDKQCHIELDLIGLKLPAEELAETVTTPVWREIKLADLPVEFRSNRIIENYMVTYDKVENSIGLKMNNIGYRISEGVLYFLYTSDKIDALSGNRNLVIDYIQ